MDNISNLLKQIRVDPRAGVDLAEQLRQQVAWLIASQRLNQGDRLPPIREMAGRLGIHMHTVRAAYAQLEAEGLVDTRRGAGTTVRQYDPRRQARQIPDLPTFTVGVILPEYSPFYLPFLRGVEHAARDEATLFLYSNAHNDSSQAARLLNQLVAKAVDGILLVALPVDLTQRLPASQAQPGRLPPVVPVDIPQAKGPVVMLDNTLAGFQAAEHLIGVHGHQRIGLVTAPLKLDNVRQVHDGYVQALREHRLPLRQEWIVEAADFSPEEGRRAGQALLTSSPEVSAIVAVSDTLAMGVLQAARGVARSVPEDLAVVGIDDMELAAFMEPPLTTVAFPAFAMGESAMTMLRTLIDSKTPRPRRQLLPTALVVRRSCGCAGAGNEHDPAIESVRLVEGGPKS